MGSSWHTIPSKWESHTESLLPVCCPIPTEEKSRFAPSTAAIDLLILSPGNQTSGLMSDFASHKIVSRRFLTLRGDALMTSSLN
eukprot:752335-Hanusia_phi.AAC.2